ncbi:ankyrin repeat protein [Acanthamoeba polyphaga moumouvirus]|uniref:Ankyrin repeat protein n=1 Tax=Acanthamoeba polyphaga moumouvirus TaxID=1269028 RepID=L7RAY1_9VIRU|nr:ankyrin repeat protein [Acanthamoeba polyphaga moumouvirus]AGC01559.1 ankyrin repeat protein [Acanthamoeba polyphaga moumouvirus]
MSYKIITTELLDNIFKNNDNCAFRKLLKSKLRDNDMTNIIYHCAKYNNLDFFDILFDELKNMNENMSFHILNVCLRTSNYILSQYVINQQFDTKIYSKLFVELCHDYDAEHIESLKLLLNNGADINYNNGYVFINACKSGHLNVFKFLLDHDLIIDYNNPNIVTGIETIIKRRNFKIIKLLLKYGFDFSFLNKNRKISNKNDIDIINILIDHNIDVVNIINLMSK